MRWAGAESGQMSAVKNVPRPVKKFVLFLRTEVILYI